MLFNDTSAQFRPFGVLIQLYNNRLTVHRQIDIIYLNTDRQTDIQVFSQIKKQIYKDQLLDSHTQARARRHTHTRAHTERGRKGESHHNNRNNNSQFIITSLYHPCIPGDATKWCRYQMTLLCRGVVKVSSIVYFMYILEVNKRQTAIF